MKFAVKFCPTELNGNSMTEFNVTLWLCTYMTILPWHRWTTGTSDNTPKTKALEGWI